MPNRVPYDQRSDLENIQSQWSKLSGLLNRGEWSAAVVRAATAAEIAANFAIREESRAKSKLSSAFVDSLLSWANGLSGKLNHLLVPLCPGKAHQKTLKNLAKVADSVNEKRNRIVHRGEFCDVEESGAVIKRTKHFVEALVGTYTPGFKLKDHARV